MKDRMGAFRGGTPFIIGTIVFFIVCAIGLRFIRNKDKLFEMGGSKSVDGFSTAPTRAADCNCLPGYIPSNTGGFDGEIYSTGGGDGSIFYLYNPNGTDKMYIIGDGNKCGLPEPNTKYSAKEKLNMIGIGSGFISSSGKKYEFTGGIYDENSCSLVKKKGSGTYFCQNLDSPGKTRSCY